MRHQEGLIDGTPEKRMFWSIVSDYNNPSALCELVDNAVDRWWSNPAEADLAVSVIADTKRQTISVLDNAGGVEEQDLRYLIAPGGSKNKQNAETIGVFGVGSKRASIALAETVFITTRHGTSRTFQISLDREWLESEHWDMPTYSVDDISPSTTKVEMTTLRHPISSEFPKELAEHFSFVYATFIASGRFTLDVNGAQVAPAFLDRWAFPKGQAPRRLTRLIDVPDGGTIVATVTSGLTLDRDPSSENYGTSFYCNGRLIARHLKTREVGYFATSAAGVPHPDASLARVIVTLDGPANSMPWNSTKTGINFTHPTFIEIQPHVIELLSHFSSLSRRLKNRWEEEVFSRPKGAVIDIPEPEVGKISHLPLPKLPRVQKTRGETLVAKNRDLISKKPWTLGLVESIAAVDVIARQRLETRNRISLLLIDSTFEIALKEYIVHRDDHFPKNQYGDAKLRELFEDRPAVVGLVAKSARLGPELITVAKHYYQLRNKLIHERATVDVVDSDVKTYRQAVEQTLTVLFNLRFE